MAVKIIKEGEPPSVTKTCEVCGCEFSFDCRDVEYNSIAAQRGLWVRDITSFALAVTREK